MVVKREFKIDNYGMTLQFNITEEDTGEPYDLTDKEVAFKMWVQGETNLQLNASCTIYNAIQGQVVYTVIEGDFDRAGTFNAELEITKANLVEATELFEVTIYGSIFNACS